MPLPRSRPLIPQAALSLAKAFFWVAATKVFLADNVLRTATISGTSMSPTLSPEYHVSQKTDVVLWKVWNVQRHLQRGDVAQFMNPSWPERFAVKRIVALPGDTVVLDPRRRPSVKEGPEPVEARAWDAWGGTAVVPPGHVWVEGDNWRESRDSNWYGPISKSLITGKAIALLWPGDRFWGKPWEGWQGRTKVIEGERVEDWTKKGLPVALSEIGDLGLGKG